MKLFGPDAKKERIANVLRIIKTGKKMNKAVLIANIEYTYGLNKETVESYLNTLEQMGKINIEADVITYISIGDNNENPTNLPKL